MGNERKPSTTKRESLRLAMFSIICLLGCAIVFAAILRLRFRKGEPKC